MAPVALHILLAFAATLGTPELRAYALTQGGPHDGVILASAAVHHVSPFTLRALLWEESKLTPGVVNPRSGACGAGQFTEAGRRGLERLRRRPFTCEHALHPVHGIEATAFMLRHLERRWGAWAAVEWYNGGKHRKGFARRVHRLAAQMRAKAGLPAHRHAHAVGRVS